MTDSSSLVLSPEDIYAITHCELASDQIEALTELGVPAVLRRIDNTVCVLRAHVTNPPSVSALHEIPAPIRKPAVPQLVSYRPEEGPTIVVSPAHMRWVLVPLFAAVTGYTEKAVRRKIEDGVWLQGQHYRKAPDGRVTMDLKAYYAWVVHGRPRFAKHSFHDESAGKDCTRTSGLWCGI